MAVTRLDILQHVLKNLDIDTEGQKIFLAHGISYVCNMNKYTGYTYQ